MAVGVKVGDQLAADHGERTRLWRVLPGELGDPVVIADREGGEALLRGRSAFEQRMMEREQRRAHQTSEVTVLSQDSRLIVDSVPQPGDGSIADQWEVDVGVKRVQVILVLLFVCPSRAADEHLMMPHASEKHKMHTCP